MDPTAQIGWSRQSVPAYAGTAEMVRDVFQAADVVHDEAMEVVDGNTLQGDEHVRSGDDAGRHSTSMSPEGSVEPIGGGDGEMVGVEGEPEHVLDKRC